MPSIIRDAKHDAALSGIVCKLKQEHMEFCDFVHEFGSHERIRCAEPPRTSTCMSSRLHTRTQRLCRTGAQALSRTQTPRM